MTREELRDTVLGVIRTIAPEVDATTLRPDASLREQVDLDSVDYLNLMIALHEKLGVDVPEADYEKLQTLQGCVQYLSERLRIA